MTVTELKVEAAKRCGLKQHAYVYTTKTACNSCYEDVAATQREQKELKDRPYAYVAWMCSEGHELDPIGGEALCETCGIKFVLQMNTGQAVIDKDECGTIYHHNFEHSKCVDCEAVDE